MLRKPDNLNTDKNDDNRLAEALLLNERLATAYYLKEYLRQFWGQGSKA